jgi:hypothetical protein
MGSFRVARGVRTLTHRAYRDRASSESLLSPAYKEEAGMKTLTISQLFEGRRGVPAAAVAAAVAALIAISPAPSTAAQQPVYAVPALPDLQVSYTNVIQYGGDTVLLFKVWNSGSANAGPFKVAAHAANGAVLQVFEARGLMPGYSVAFSHQLPPCTLSGSLTRTIVTDSDSTVVESNEGNNEKKAVFVYGPRCSTAPALVH